MSDMYLDETIHSHQSCDIQTPLQVLGFSGDSAVGQLKLSNYSFVQAFFTLRLCHCGVNHQEYKKSDREIVSSGVEGTMTSKSLTVTLCSYFLFRKMTRASIWEEYDVNLATSRSPSQVLYLRSLTTFVEVP